MDSVTLTLAAIGAGIGGAYWWLARKTSMPLQDLKMVKQLLTWKPYFTKFAVKQDENFSDHWEELVAQYGDRKSFEMIEEGGKSTIKSFREIETAARQIAHWGLKLGLKKGDVIALLDDNSLEYYAIFLGMAKLGVITALLNNHLTGKPLVHAISSVSPKVLLFSSSQKHHVAEIKSQLDPSLAMWSFHEPVPESTYLNFEDYPSEPISKSMRKGCGYRDTFLYIYTSGTTGLPKASVITYLRFFMVGTLFSGVNPWQEGVNERMYLTLPLYHSSGQFLSCCAMVGGRTIVLRKKFSVTKFWDDCVAYGCTSFIYIGEICRYLTLQPPNDKETKHSIKFGVGNGCRPDVWSKFIERFQVPLLCEFYGATESNVALINTYGKVGAVGRISPLIRSFYPVTILRVDSESGDLIRDANGMCIEAADNEIGEIAGLIKEDDPTRQFKGYTDSNATNKKIIVDALKKGDKWFRTGDLMKRDSDGWIYFIDRLGDTFRWHGENVSTTEVEGIIAVFPGVNFNVVYGVSVPGHDGRAGAVVLVLEDKHNFTWKKFYDHIMSQLPSYAAPLFVRIADTVEMTGTAKYRKGNLVSDGIDLTKVKDPMFFRNDKTKQFEEFTQATLDKIAKGEIKI